VIDLRDPRVSDSGKCDSMATKSTPPAQNARRLRHRAATLLAVVVITIVVIASPSMAAVSAGQPGLTSMPGSMQSGELPVRKEDRDIRVYDKADILTGSQEAALEVDLARASRLGVEILVYTRLSAESRDESQAFADQLRAAWGVESAEGAGDGLTYLISVGPESPDIDTVVISSGANTFPIRQLDQATMQGILDDEMTPQVEEGEFNRALLDGVRRVLNLADYSPPDPAALSPTQHHFRFAAVILAAGLLQVAAIGYFLVPALRERRLTLLPTSGSLAIYAVALGVLAVATGIVAIIGRSTFGSLTSLGAVIWAGCIVPLLIGFLSRRREEPDAVQHARVRATAIGPVNVQ